MVRIYLEGGGDIKEKDQISSDKDAVDRSLNKNMLVIDLSTDNIEKRKNYQEIIGNYFRILGVKEIDFISNFKNIPMKNYGILYLPGGETETLLKNILNGGYNDYLLDFDGTIIGNSAGALILGSQGILLKNSHRKFIKSIRGLGLINFGICTHYEEKHIRDIKKIKDKKEIYLIPEKEALIWENGKITASPGISII